MIHDNVTTTFCPTTCKPQIERTAFIHPLAVVIGNVAVGRGVMVAPFASIRGDEGQPIVIGDDSDVQDGVVIHGLETEKDGQPVSKNRVFVDGKAYSVYIGQRVSLAHQAQAHGPAHIDSDTFVGMKSLVFRATIGCACVIEPGCIVMGVNIDANRYIPAGTVVRTQAEADELPVIDDNYPFKDLNRGVVRVNKRLAEGYRRLHLE